MLHTRLLIVGTDAIVRLDLRELLEALGYQVVGEAGDGPGAIRLARDLRPDLVLLDLRLSGPLDDMDVASVLTSEQGAPVLLLTACGDLAGAHRVVQAGAASYLVTPFDEDQLRPVIEMVLARDPKFPIRARDAGDLGVQREELTFLERVKGLVLEQQPIGEPAAFRPIQAASTNACPPVSRVAGAILRAEHVPPDPPQAIPDL